MEQSPSQYRGLSVDDVQQCDCWHHHFRRGSSVFSQSHIKVFGSLADVGSLTIGALELVNYSLPVVRFTLRTLLEL